MIEDPHEKKSEGNLDVKIKKNNIDDTDDKRKTKNFLKKKVIEDPTEEKSKGDPDVKVGKKEY